MKQGVWRFRIATVYDRDGEQAELIGYLDLKSADGWDRLTLPRAGEVLWLVSEAHECDAE